METHFLFKKVSLVGILAIAVFSVLLIVPVTDNFIEHSKTYTLFFGAVLTLILFVVKTFQEKAMRITVSPITGALLLFGLATTAATFFTADYPVEGLLGTGGIFLSTTIIALFGGSLLPKTTTKEFLQVLTGTSVGLTVFTVLQMVGFGPAQLINRVLGVTLPTSVAFNVSGSPFIALQVVALTLVAVLYQVVTTKKLSKFFATTLPVLVVGAGIFTWSLLPGKDTSLILPSFTASWSVMLDTIRSPRSALIGAGVTSYSNVYQIFKPSWINQTDNWAISFTQGATMPLTLVTIMGIFGLIAWILLVVSFVKFHKKSLIDSKPIGVFIATSFLLNILLPFNTVLLTLQAIAFACLVANEKHRLPLLQLQALKFKMLNKAETLGTNKKPNNLALYITTGVSMVSVLALGYLVSRSLQAQVVMAESSKALAQEEVVKGYELQQKAVRLNPYLDTFRRRYSATSAGIAIALSNKADLTDAEKQQVSELLQQSVTEARAATTLDGLDSQNWANLAQVYSNLIGVSEDAVDWTIQSYVSAIETNPNDPLLRLDLASIFVSQEAYEQALGVYDQAINIKPDLAISHFNRGLLLEKIESPEALREARLSFQRALVLLEADSEDYIAVNTKIENLEKFMEENDISLVAPETETQNQQDTTTQNATSSSKLSAPSITEQNLNNTNALNADSEPVDVNFAEPSAQQSETSNSQDSEVTQ